MMTASSSAQFHQNYSYEDFMMGYKPVNDGFELEAWHILSFLSEGGKPS
ncbi:MAG: hypothetical protein ACLTBV_13500 [Enterocloster bolteae]